MWQVDNDRYAVWRLEHELGIKPVDRLLNSVTASDRAETPRMNVRPLVGVLHRLLRLLCSRPATGLIVRRASE